MKPILFNTEMVQAILEGGKTTTRRVVKSHGDTPAFYKRDKFYKLVDKLNNDVGLYAGFYKDSDVFECEGAEHIDAIYFKSPYQVGDMLYVQETWKVIQLLENMQMQFEYRADNAISKVIDFILNRFIKFKKFADKHGWQSPYFMPREAARIFLKVTGVRVERLQDITTKNIEQEGFYCDPPYTKDHFAYAPGMLIHFIRTWDSIYSTKGYGWEANPWVWVISFEKVDKP